MLLCFDWQVGLLVVYYRANRLLQKASRSKTAEKTCSDAAVVEKVLKCIKGIYTLFTPWFDVDVFMSDERMYQVAGARKMTHNY